MLRGVPTSGLSRVFHSNGIRRGFVLNRGGKVISSHDALNPIRDFVENDTVDYDAHEGMFFEAYEDCMFGAFLWRTHRGQGAGGVRLRKYDDAEAFVRDGMRLCIGMGRKNALANIWWGGGKGIIGHGDDEEMISNPEKRRQMLRAYGEFMSSLRGAYIGAEDAGLNVNDMDVISEKTRFITCISPSLGGSGNPSVPTAMGIRCGIEGALDALDMGTLEGKTVAVQGCGNVGGPLVKFLFDKGVAHVIASDPSEERRQAVRDACEHYADKLTFRYPGDGETPDDYNILHEDVDIVSPCAFGGVLNEHTVPGIKAKIVCGAANNQLLDPKNEYGMTDKGIIYCPDFVVNRMGIVNCANEGFGRVGDPGGVEDPLIASHLGRQDPNSVFNITRDIIIRAKAEGTSTAAMAEKMADEHAHITNPMFGHRTKDIIESLVLDGWACHSK
mmetsp:Transcript_3394/g.4904  ORF Transcript_3394/g.4904 Transcript_3394/m.4904 type:complete len:444 (-) Transcript_3394:47-1378(-)|eukprot:CAMPEP_0203795352 /NCGR_PEP_ID=MMETSP0100_2-20121128/7167_1 /ASSEMBLY_ACC=CAM_ASM_000210 /TAXON_ID=96639 /ORGANISM=" , Strain NY0313808BC1" /LENGTH=443 /DNA_ID=CAMNT_0050699821 /DNA_START=212 /DNA_END=1543 /DNA_ORIENTATION=-